MLWLSFPESFAGFVFSFTTSFFFLLALSDMIYLSAIINIVNNQEVMAKKKRKRRYNEYNKRSQKDLPATSRGKVSEYKAAIDRKGLLLPRGLKSCRFHTAEMKEPRQRTVF